MRVNRLRQTLTLAIVVLAVAVPTPATAQADTLETPIIGSTATVENTFTSLDHNDGDPTSVGGAGPVVIDDSVEFPSCCDGPDYKSAYDIDVGLDRVTMTWVGDDDLARVIEAGTVDEYTFTFADANFKRAFADHSQLLAPAVTWTDDSITVTITEGDEVGPGRTIVVIVTPFAPNADGSTAGETAVVAVDNAASDEGAPARLPRTGPSDSLWLALVATALLGAGLILFGAATHSDLT